MDGCGIALLINLLLCCAFFFPGIIHAFYVVLKSGNKEVMEGWGCQGEGWVP